MPLFSTPTTHVFLSSSNYCYQNFSTWPQTELLFRVKWAHKIISFNLTFEWVLLMCCGLPDTKKENVSKINRSQHDDWAWDVPHMPGDAERDISAKEVISLLGRQNIRKIFLGECSEIAEELCGLHLWRSQTQCMLSWVPRWPQNKVIRASAVHRRSSPAWQSHLMQMS